MCRARYGTVFWNS
ncbi:hypothetical protein MKC74_06475 [[Clostridium] innocuum]|nr:hypothetical protein [[Clostridium] innocuum]